MHIKSIKTYHDTPSDDSPHIFHLLRDVTIFGVFGVPVRKKQHYITDDGQQRQRVQGHSDEAGTFSSAHGVIFLALEQIQSEFVPKTLSEERG